MNRIITILGALALIGGLAGTGTNPLNYAG